MKQIIALHFIGTRLVRTVSSRPKARAYRVEPREEREIVPTYLRNRE